MNDSGWIEIKFAKGDMPKGYREFSYGGEPDLVVYSHNEGEWFWKHRARMPKAANLYSPEDTHIGAAITALHYLIGLRAAEMDEELERHSTLPTPPDVVPLTRLPRHVIKREDIVNANSVKALPVPAISYNPMLHGETDCFETIHGETYAMVTVKLSGEAIFQSLAEKVGVKFDADGIIPPALCYEEPNGDLVIHQ